MAREMARVIARVIGLLSPEIIILPHTARSVGLFTNNSICEPDGRNSDPVIGTETHRPTCNTSDNEMADRSRDIAHLVVVDR